MKTRSASRDSHNVMMVWAIAYAAQNRVQYPMMEDSNNTIKCRDIPLSAYFPNPEDSSAIRYPMKVLVSRILLQNIPYFEECYKDTVTWHILHPHSEEASHRRSKLVKKYLNLQRTCTYTFHMTDAMVLIQEDWPFCLQIVAFPNDLY